MTRPAGTAYDHRHLTLQSGSRLGHYEILDAIGRGGMGEVWRARDTRLRRLVAIKMLPSTLAGLPNRLVRLEREAELLATLNHRHIATIHGIEELDGARFLILELVDGETLEDRLGVGAITRDEALAVALQIAHGLEAAHARGIVHRDLKPANIMITPERQVKILDFGLAKALVPIQGQGERQAPDPTETGAVVGTPAYMSPEQARGEATSVQADIWSFGVVLYEMLTGISPFKRNTTAETLASVLDGQFVLAAVPLETPPLVGRLIQRCLEKDPGRRLQHIGDVRILLEESIAPSGMQWFPAPRHATERSDRRWAAWIAAGLAAATVAGFAIWSRASQRGEGRPAPPVYVSMAFQGQPFPHPFGQRTLAIAPDGSSVAFVSAQDLWIRQLDQKDAMSVPARAPNNPFFSPDGEWVGMFSEAGLVKAPVRGGAPVTIAANVDRPAGAAWRADGTIVFATSEGLHRVSAHGGAPTLLVKPDRERNELTYGWPQFLPDGQSVLFTSVSGPGGPPPQLTRLNLTTLERTPLLTGSSAYFLKSGHLVFLAEARLYAVSFDPTAGAVRGVPVPYPGIDIATGADNAAANFAVSDSGTLIFTAPVTAADRTLRWIDRRGSQQDVGVEPQNYGYATVSPDGTRVAVERTVQGNRDIWILDLKRLTQTQLTNGPTEDMLPVWSTDGHRVFFASRRTGNFDVYSQAADGATPARLEYGGPEFQAPNSATPDGTRLLVYDRFQDLAVLTLGRTDRLTPLLTSPADERLVQLSSDGRWIAYESDESGDQFEIMLRSFPDVTERREQISVNGGRYPRWGPPGSDELYYVAPDGTMMAASVRLAPALTLGAVRKLFAWRKPPAARSGVMYDVAPDGRFLVTAANVLSPEGPTTVSVILNWSSQLPRIGQ